MANKKTSDYVSITTSEGTDLLDIARTGIGNFKQSIDNFITQVLGSIPADSIDETLLSPGVQDALNDGQAAFSRVPSGSFDIDPVFDDTFFLIVEEPNGITIDGLSNLRTGAGTVTLTVQINGVDVTGLTGLSVTTTPQSPTASGANTVNIGDEVTLVLSSSSSAEKLRFQLIGSWL